ncbi:MAG: hypothetical protein JO348_03130, partial [Alphaproteobacteria bacterium]|nr:hypothetical protein [Alphaproteobacteria bacterium]
GVALDSAQPAPFTPLFLGPTQVGHTLSSVYSPTLRRAIALAQVDNERTAAGTQLALLLPPARDRLVPDLAAAHVSDLPFLPPPDPLPA